MTKAPNRSSRKLVLYAVIVVIFGLIAVVGASQLARRQLDKGTTTKEQCQSQSQTSHTVAVQDGKVTPDHVDALQCDKLTVINQDDGVRLMAFGMHDAHVTYDGISQKSLGKGQSFTVTLVKTGDFRVHDHAHDEIRATFSVVAR